MTGRRFLCAAGLSQILLLIACDSGTEAPRLSPTSPATNTVRTTLSGRVFELIPGGRIPAAAVPVYVAVLTTSGCAPPCTSMRTATYEQTATGPDGRYHFPTLPPGSAVVTVQSRTHRQVCGAFTELSAASELNVEITSTANPQTSPAMPSLRVSGQIYEVTPAGRVGVAGAVLYLEWYNDMPFLSVYADGDGRYVACGIPANRQIAFWPLVWQQGFEDPYVWHQFSADSTLDIALKRRNTP